MSRISIETKELIGRRAEFYMYKSPHTPKFGQFINFLEAEEDVKISYKNPDSIQPTQQLLLFRCGVRAAWLEGGAMKASVEVYEIVDVYKKIKEPGLASDQYSDLSQKGILYTLNLEYLRLR